jgi:quinohemoprotein ethanol dehydrogenase
VHQREAWKVEYPGPWNGGVLSTAGNLVFQGTATGSFNAYAADDGRRLWSFAAQTGVMAGPISYSVGGKQYVAVVAGYGGGIPLALPTFTASHTWPNGRVLAFALDGHTSLPPFTPVRAPPNPGTDSWSAETVTRGKDLYGVSCLGCHGIGTLSSGIVPDLRRSAALSSREAWQSIVIRGALTDAGMISFARYLNADQAEAIRAYVTEQARTVSASPPSPRPQVAR